MRKGYDYEKETGQRPRINRSTLRNINYDAMNFRLRGLFARLQFKALELDNSKPYDVYSLGEGILYAISENPECAKPLTKKEGIVFICEEGYKNKMIKKISLLNQNGHQE